MFGTNDQVEHFGKKKKTIKVSGKAVIAVVLIIIAIAVFVYIGTRMDKASAAAAPGTTPSVPKPVTGGSRYHR